jgi:hypothetical protein
MKEIRGVDALSQRGRPHDRHRYCETPVDPARSKTSAEWPFDYHSLCAGELRKLTALMATNAIRPGYGYHGLHDGRRSVRALVGRPRFAPAGRARCGERAAPSTAHCGAAKDPGSGPVDAVGALRHEPCRTPRTRVAHGGLTRSASDAASLAPSRISRAVATTFCRRPSSFSSRWLRTRSTIGWPGGSTICETKFAFSKRPSRRQSARRGSTSTPSSDVAWPLGAKL